MFASVQTATRLASAAVEITGLRKQFGDQVVVDDLTLTLAAGTITGLVGRGKTTVLAMVAGVLPPDDGNVRVFGVDVWSDRPHAMASTPLDGGPHLDDPTAWATLTRAAVRHGLDPEEAVLRSWDLLAQLGLSAVATVRLGDYSPGMHSRLLLARALVGRPAVLVLDDLFRGVDDESARRIRLVLERFVTSGGAVLLSGEHPHGLCDEVRMLA